MIRLPGMALVLLGLAAARAAAPEQPAAPSAPAAAESPAYNIEIVIFRTGGSPGGEDWSALPPLRGGSGTDADASTSTRVGHFVRALAPAQFQLNEVEGRLRAGGFQPLAHLAWSQTPSPFGSHAGFTLQRLGAGAAGLGGIVFLEHGQFLHLGMSLTYTPGGDSAGGPTYRLSELRRVRFYEKNYFDHPAFGVIALVTPAQGTRAPGR